MTGPNDPGLSGGGVRYGVMRRVASYLTSGGAPFRAWVAFQKADVPLSCRADSPRFPLVFSVFGAKFKEPPLHLSWGRAVNILSMR